MPSKDTTCARLAAWPDARVDEMAAPVEELVAIDSAMRTCDSISSS